MSDLDSNAGRVSTSAPITALANGKVPSFNRAISPLGTSNGLVDGFAEVFAQMAASATPASKPLSVQRPEKDTSSNDNTEPIDQSDSNESVDENEASDDLAKSSDVTDAAVAISTDQADTITAEKETDETPRDDEATAAEVATIVAADAKRIETSDANGNVDDSIASGLSNDPAVDTALETSQLKETVRKETAEITSPINANDKHGSTADDADVGTSEVVSATSDFVVESNGGDEGSDDSPRDRRRGRQATRSASETSQAVIENQSKRSPDDHGFEIPDAIAAQTGADEAAASDLHAMTEKATRAVQNQTAAVSNVIQSVAATGQIATQTSTNLSGGTGSDTSNAVRSPSMSVEPPAGSRADADAKANANAATAENKSAADMMTRIKLIQRVSKAFQHLGPEGGVVRLRLAPAELGTVRVEMRIHQKKIEARVVADTEAASAALREHLPELRGRLEALGMNVEKIEVETDSSFTQNDSSFNDSSSLANQDSDWNRQTQRSPRRPVSQAGGKVSRPLSSANSPIVSVGSYGGSGVDVRL